MSVVGIQVEPRQPQSVIGAKNVRLKSYLQSLQSKFFTLPLLSTAAGRFFLFFKFLDYKSPNMMCALMMPLLLLLNAGLVFCYSPSTGAPLSSAHHTPSRLPAHRISSRGDHPRAGAHMGLWDDLASKAAQAFENEVTCFGG